MKNVVKALQRIFPKYSARTDELVAHGGAGWFARSSI